jgi:hypothetical protein
MSEHSVNNNSDNTKTSSCFRMSIILGIVLWTDFGALWHPILRRENASTITLNLPWVFVYKSPAENALRESIINSALKWGIIEQKEENDFNVVAYKVLTSSHHVQLE